MPILDITMLGFVLVVAGGFLVWFIKEVRSDEEK